MKTRLILFFALLLSSLSFAQTSFPVSISNPVTLDQMVIQNRARLFPYAATVFSATPATVTKGVNINTGFGFFVRPGKRYYLNSVTFTANGPCLVELRTSLDNANNWWPYIGLASASQITGTYRFSQVFGPTGGSITVNMPAGYILEQNTSYSLSYTPFDTLTKNVAFQVSGYEIPSETNLNAKFRIVFDGDSNCWGNNMGNDTTGKAYLGNWHFSEVLRARARQAGVDAQVYANYADDGKTMMEGYYQESRGAHRCSYDAMYICYGMNDAPLASYPTEAKFKEAARNYIYSRNINNIGKPIVFLGMPLTDDTARTNGGRYANIKQWIIDVANDPIIGGSANKVYYFDLGTVNALPASTSIYYKEQSVPHVHLSGLGQTAAGNALYEFSKTRVFGIQ